MKEKKARVEVALHRNACAAARRRASFPAVA
jgi:hypothetical protein